MITDTKKWHYLALKNERTFDGEKWHNRAVTSLSRLLSRITSSYHSYSTVDLKNMKKYVMIMVTVIQKCLRETKKY